MKYLALLSLFALSACATGSGGEHEVDFGDQPARRPYAPAASEAAAPAPEPDFLKDPSAAPQERKSGRSDAELEQTASMLRNTPSVGPNGFKTMADPTTGAQRGLAPGSASFGGGR